MASSSISAAFCCTIGRKGFRNSGLGFKTQHRPGHVIYQHPDVSYDPSSVRCCKTNGLLF